jgi:hypothetical protein
MRERKTQEIAVNSTKCASLQMTPRWIPPEISIFNLGGEKVEAQIFASAGM